MIGGTKNIFKDTGEFFHTLNKQSFISGGTRAPTGGNIINIQLWNPAASGKVLICQRLVAYIQTSTPKYFNIGHHNAALADGLLDMGNKFLGQGAGAGSLRYASGAALGTSICRIYDLGSTLHQQKTSFPFKQGILIPEGFGLTINPENVDVSLHCQIQWFEIDA